MAKRFVQMAVYGEPGSGKSTFAAGAPNAFFVCSDNNFGWLGLPDEQHVVCSNWNQFSKVVELLFTDMFDWCETVVIDLLEDFYKQAEDDFNKKNALQYIGDLDYGKGWRIVKDNFLNAVKKLVTLQKNVIFIMHGTTDTSSKDRKGNVITKYIPAPSLARVIDEVEGKVRFFVRAYTTAETEETEDGQILKTQYLISLLPKENEYGIARGVTAEEVPTDIENNWEVFAEVVGLNKQSSGTGITDFQKMINDIKESSKTRPQVKPVGNAPATPAAPQPTAPAKPVVKPTIQSTKAMTPTVKPTVKPAVAPKTEEPKVEETKVEEVKAEETKVEEVKAETPQVEETKVEAPKAESPKTEEKKISSASKEELLAKLEGKKAVQEEKPVEAPKAETKAQEAPKASSIDRLAALKALKAKK